MSDNVTSIFGKDTMTVADCIDLATDLELLAKRIRAGEVNAVRGVFVYQSADTRIHNLALGEALTKLESIGLLAWSVEEVKHG